MTTFQAGRQNIYFKTAKHQHCNKYARKRGNSCGGTHNENFCHELINYAVRIVRVHSQSVMYGTGRSNV